MKIKEITSQHRRDFWAIYVCENCNAEEKGDGYDDSFFHNEVIPKKVCKSCNKTSPKNGYTPLAPKHPEGKQL